MFADGPIYAEGVPGQELLEEMQTADYSPKRISRARWFCAMGREPAVVAESRKDGLMGKLPEASDYCVAALTRSAHDHVLPELYSRLKTELGVSTEGYEKLPAAIGASVLNNGTTVDIGNDMHTDVSPSLAFDAGFTVAYQTGASHEGKINETRMKEVAESCLGGGLDAGSCYSVGFIYGVRTYQAAAGH
jgi:hypothetical protein